MRMEPNIYRRNDGRYEGRYPSGVGDDGRARYTSVFAHTYAEVREKLDRAKSRVTAGQKPPSARQSVTEVVAAHIDASRATLKPSTLGIYRRHLERHIAPHFGKAKCSSLSKEVTQEFVNSLIESGLAAKSVQSVFTLFRAGVKDACGDIFHVRMPRKRRDEVEFFTVDEQKRVEAAARASGESDCVAVTLALYTGLRVGEVCGLKWDDIDFRSGVLRVNRTYQRVPNPRGGGSRTKLDFFAPKSETSERTIPLPDFLRDLLSDVRTKSKGEFVVANSVGKPVEPRTLQNRFKRLLIAADVRDVNFHTTRHSFAVRALENGFDVKSLSEIMGHANATITLNRYAHATDTRKRACMDALSAVYSEG